MKRKLLYLIKMVSKNLLYGLVLQCLLMTTLMAHEISAQIKPIDESYVRLKTSEWRLEEIFHLVEANTDYHFVLPEDILDNSSLLELKSKKQSVNELLMDIALGANLKFKQVDNSIYVARGNQTPKAPIEILIEERPISGRILDPNGEGIPGATVLVEGTTIGTATDIDGNFTLDVPDDAILVISYIGYESQRIELGNQNEITVTMEEDLSSLDEIVVVGYGTQKKVNLTGAVSTVT
ncbi:MAG: carboxypeptidase-like regulatory domain-containing protein, partial [Cyclobacterium sp.]|uniref:carboxypeptidase-like regulatory domain-containing protein n=1 Tax=Cyclobacterium sp. TaxID=1966343 RepID=UPI0039710D20